MRLTCFLSLFLLATPTLAQDPTPVTLTASSIQDGRDPWMAADSDNGTRWCAANGNKPQWLQLEFDEPQEINQVDIIWENPNDTYGYTLEGSMDGTVWSRLHDASSNKKHGNTSDTFAPTPLRFLRLTGLSTGRGWISLFEINVKGTGVHSIAAKNGPQRSSHPEAGQDFSKAGNITPLIVELSPNVEADILKDVTVPSGFEKTLFAPWQSANYPVYVAATPGGDLFVSSDGNGSLGRNPGRGRVMRLRDEDGDGRADEVTEFIKEVDSPRGIIWDHDRLYVLHPPHITAYFDRDNDGVSDDAIRLVSNIAFGFKDRPADHTTNGLELGPDGWIYIAGGDFGFMEAVGTDGRTLQHRGGGIIRVRTDGSGLEVFSTGTRNILCTPLSPLLDPFARDNTNDGGGWDVRFHHFSGLDDHGYPRLYMNFPDEIVHPLADYGGGSGCGGVYIHEPGFPKEWANAPFTCDWGRAGLFRHSVQRQGAGFIETKAPEVFVKLTRPTDADVDGMSRVYQASWRGPAVFNWGGPDHGYITRVTPKHFTPEPLPDFDGLNDLDLVQLLESPSQVRALAAQRTLLRRDEVPATLTSLSSLASNRSKELRSRVLALYAITQRGVDSTKSGRVIDTIRPLAQDPTIAAFVMRALGDLGIDLLTNGQPGAAPSDLLIAGANSSDPRTRLEAIIAAARQKRTEVAGAVAESFGHTDLVIAHAAFRSFALLGDPQPALAILDNPASHEAQRRGASLALMRMHDRTLVEALIQRLDTAPTAARPHVFSILSRLYHRDAEWKSEYWGGRPDTRGPYYDPVTWELSPTILSALHDALAKAAPADAGNMIAVMGRNRIQDDGALNRILKLAQQDASHIPTAISQLVKSDDLPAEAIPLLHQSAKAASTPPEVLVQTIECLMKVQDEEAMASVLTAMARLDQSVEHRLHQNPARELFIASKGLDNWIHQLVETAKDDIKDSKTIWAHAALLELASRKNANAEARSMAQGELDVAWQDTDRRVKLIVLARVINRHYLDGRIAAALTDPSPEVAQQAKATAAHLKIQPPGADKTPKVGSFDIEAALAQVKEMKGDPALGEAIFIKASCVTCHTVSQDQPQKGPYMGNISNIYRRHDLAEAILNPAKSIAQGFATYLLKLKDGTPLMGFITKETTDEVHIRDIVGQETIVKTDTIAERSTLPISMMPPGLMNDFTVQEFASLLDYIESLSKE